jgi:hypothetical protein
MTNHNFKLGLKILALILSWQFLLAPLVQAAPPGAVTQCPEPPCVFNPGPGPANPSDWQPSPGGANQQETFPGNRPSAPNQFNNRTPSSNAHWWQVLGSTGFIFFTVLNVLVLGNLEPVSYSGTATVLADGLAYYVSNFF